MQYNIIDFRTLPESVNSREIEEAINDRKLLFKAGSLIEIGFASMPEVTAAVERAMKVCYNNGLDIQEHFKAIYISDNDKHTICRDWKLSKLAYTLVMINGACDNPMVGRLQLEILNRYLAAKSVLEEV